MLGLAALDGQADEIAQQADLAIRALGASLRSMRRYRATSGAVIAAAGTSPNTRSSGAVVAVVGLGALAQVGPLRARLVLLPQPADGASVVVLAEQVGDTSRSASALSVPSAIGLPPTGW
ncbi:MAG: hypothetical protein U1F25_13780 [Rubrivivax sp.]